VSGPLASDARDESALWDWAVAAYGRPGAKDALLSLQDRHGIDVVLTLWRAWLWETRRRITNEGEARAIALSADWRQNVVTPLRRARNALKAAPAGIDADAALALRRQLLDVELAAERLQLQALERLALTPAAAKPSETALCGGRKSLYDHFVAFPPLASVPVVEIATLTTVLLGQ
jgi:uncharacterized protein (TIGR02444 family)